MWDGLEPGQLAVAAEQTIYTERKYRKAKGGGHQGHSPGSYPADEMGRTKGHWNTMCSNTRTQIRYGIKEGAAAGTKEGRIKRKRGLLMLEGLDTADSQVTIDGEDGDGSIDMLFDAFGQWRSVRVSSGNGEMV